MRIRSDHITRIVSGFLMANVSSHHKHSGSLSSE